MTAFIDGESLSNDQRVELSDGGYLSIIQTAMIEETAAPNAEIQLDALAATKLFDFLLLHQDRLQRHAKAIQYNRDMAQRDHIIASTVEKPWLPLHDGE